MHTISIYEGSHFRFSGGEVHTQIDLSDIGATEYQLILRDYSSDGVMALFHAQEVLRRHGALAIHAVIPYLPYARQDRVMHPLEPFSLRTFAGLINAQRFASVTIYDPHSDVAPALIDNCRVIPQWDIAKRVVGHLLNNPEVIVVSPDAGAYKKVAKLVSDDARIALGTKQRDSEGRITHTDVVRVRTLREKTCLIVDDICDGGRTFTALAGALKVQGAAKVVLYVTHGIFSNGFDNLWGAGNIDEIFTTNTIIRKAEPHAFLHTYELDFKGGL